MTCPRSHAPLKIQKAMTLFQKQASHEARNRKAAKVILADVSRYGGEESAIVQWARAVTRDLPIVRIVAGDVPHKL
jgi:hypothetical protein